jgi:hypothetical protein
LTESEGHEASPALPFAGVSSLRRFDAPGTYIDERGTEYITWHIGPYVPPRLGPIYDIRTTIRGIEFSGTDFDALAPHDERQAEQAGFVRVDLDWLRAATLSGVLPCTIYRAESPSRASIEFVLPLGDPYEDHALRLKLLGPMPVAEGEGGSFEDAMISLLERIPFDVRPVCCFTCLYSDYSPAGHGLTGMICHRTAKERYRATRSKYEVMATQAAELVLETHLCPEWEKRVPGTGYRG